MEKIINSDGSIPMGIFDSPVEEINGQDYLLLTAFGRRVPPLIKRWLYKRFNFIGITTPNLMVGLAVVDLGYISSAFAYVYHRKEKWLKEKSSISFMGNGAVIAPFPERPNSSYGNKKIAISMDDQNIKAACGNLKIMVTLDDFKAVKPLRICTRAGYRGWSFTRKAAPLPVSGRVEVEGRVFEVEPGNSFAISDWTAGFLKYNTFWNWAAIASRLSDGRTIGLNLSWGVNETGFTENLFWIDSIMTKVDTVSFSKDESGLNWRIRSHDKRVELEFKPEGSRGENVNALVIATRFTQYFGRFTGRLITRDKEVVSIDNIFGWTEDHFARW